MKWTTNTFYVGYIQATFKNIHKIGMNVTIHVHVHVGPM